MVKLTVALVSFIVIVVIAFVAVTFCVSWMKSLTVSEREELKDCERDVRRACDDLKYEQNRNKEK